MKCELCQFNNPKGTATAVIIREGKVLFLKRIEEPFKGQWDLPGGYMNEEETPEESLKRELKEELGIRGRLDFIGWFPGKALWENRTFPILSHAYLVEPEGDIKLNHNENSEYQWQDLRELDLDTVAFDSNQKIVEFIRSKFIIDYTKLKELVKQLDSSAEIKEINFYRSLLNGYLSRKVVNGKLVGVGWIYPRQTLLRHQAVIEDMVVDEKERGKGYGREILLDLLNWAKEKGVEVVELTSGSHRVAANKLYQKTGFKLHPTNHYLYKV